MEIYNQIKHISMLTNKQRGYSLFILQPCYLIATLTIFLLSPMLGLPFSAIVVLIPSLAFACFVARMQEKKLYLLRKLILSEAGVYVDVNALYEFLKKYEDAGTLKDLHRKELINHGFRLNEVQAEKLAIVLRSYATVESTLHHNTSSSIGLRSKSLRGRNLETLRSTVPS